MGFSQDQLDECADGADPRAAYIALLKPSALQRHCAKNAFTDDELDRCADAPSPLLAYLRLLLPP